MVVDGPMDGQERRCLSFQALQTLSMVSITCIYIYKYVIFYGLGLQQCFFTRQVLHAAMSGTSADVDGQIGIGRNSRVVRWAEQQRRHFTTCASLALAPAGGT